MLLDTLDPPTFLFIIQISGYFSFVIIFSIFSLFSKTTSSLGYLVLVYIGNENLFRFEHLWNGPCIIDRSLKNSGCGCFSSAISIAKLVHCGGISIIFLLCHRSHCFFISSSTFLRSASVYFAFSILDPLNFLFYNTNLRVFFIRNYF